MERPILPNTSGSIVRKPGVLQLREHGTICTRGVIQSQTMLNQSFAKSEFHEKDLFDYRVCGTKYQSI